MTPREPLPRKYSFVDFMGIAWQVVRCLVLFYIATRRKLLDLVVSTMLPQAFFPSFLISEASFTKHGSRKVFTANKVRLAHLVSKHSGVLLVPQFNENFAMYLRTVALSMPDVTTDFIANAHLSQCRGIHKNHRGSVLR